MRNIKTSPPKTVWIDLDNTPHVPFFIPIIKELENHGAQVVLTARDAFQVCELAAQKGLAFETIGRHWGKRKSMKAIGWLQRSIRLAPFAWRNGPDLALSHGSRSQVLIARLLRIPTVVIADYEHVRTAPFAVPDWEICPDVIRATDLPGRKVLRYHGLKEDVYVPFFRPDATIMGALGLSEGEVTLTVRPPATEAHYHNPESEELFSETMSWILAHPGTKVVLLPRNRKQAGSIRRDHPSWFNEKRVIIPDSAVDGLNLVFFSDAVVSGGGTMNREAAALGVPVYSIFRGPLGEVDRQLVAEGRLVMISTVREIRTKLKLEKRDKQSSFESGERPALGQIVNHIESILRQAKKGRVAKSR
jgi:predicted glycosyltransferase